ncbi:MAG: efflux RND transporter periplasmic adaptor subunit [Phycisphaerales bacterium]
MVLNSLHAWEAPPNVGHFFPTRHHRARTARVAHRIHPHRRAQRGGGCDRHKEAPPPPPPPEVVVAPVTKRDVTVTGEWLGTTDGLVNAAVRSRVQGYLHKQLYADGAFVKAGTLLYKIDPRPFDAEVARAKADLAKAKANQVRTELDVARLTPLAPSGAVSQQEVDTARQENEANKAAVQANEAAVKQAELNLEYTDVICPIDGVVAASSAQVGDLVGGVGGPVLTTVSTLDPIRVYFPISEQEYMRVVNSGRFDPKKTGEKPGIELEMILADGSVYPHKGEVDYLNRQVGTTTGTIQVGATFPNPGNGIRPGQYARVRAATRVKPGALLVPQRAVIEVQGLRQVAIVTDDNKVAFRAVTCAERIGSDWVIDKGLEPDDTVIVEGLQKVKDGSTVTTREYKPAKPSGKKNNDADNADGAEKPEKTEKSDKAEKKAH